MIKNEKLLGLILALLIIGAYYLGICGEINYSGFLEKPTSTREYAVAIFLIYAGYFVLKTFISRLIKFFLRGTFSSDSKVVKQSRSVSEMMAIILIWTFILGTESQKTQPDVQLFSPERWDGLLCWVLAIPFLVYFLPSPIKRAIDEELPERGTVFLEVKEGKWKKIGRVRPIL